VEQPAEQFNRRLRDEGLPVQVANMSSIWSVVYTRPSRYNWMLQYYLRAEGLALSWIGTGRFIFSLNYTDADFEAVTSKFVTAARAMQQDGWWCPIFGDKHIDQAANPAGDGCSPPQTETPPHPRRIVLRRHRIEQLAAHQVERRHVIELDIVKRIGQDFAAHASPVSTSLMKNSWTVR